MAERGGQIGNKNATKEQRLITNALRRVVVQNPDKLRNACIKLLDDAEQGNLGAFNAITDRLEGKPAQSVTLLGDEDNPLVTKVEIVPLANKTDTDPE